MINVNDQTIDVDKKHLHLCIMRNVERNIPKTVRKRKRKWQLVMDYMLGNTSKGGSTSCYFHCKFLGVDPEGYTFWEKKEEG